jgi:serine/threonine-protein kinase
MELDELKVTMRELEQRLAQESRLHLEARREHTRFRVHGNLWPVYLLHAGQVVMGVFLALLVGPFWVSRFDQTHLLVAGVVVHAYAVAMIALGTRTLTLLWSMDFGAPVLAIQEQLARVRRAYIRGGLVIGLPWWFLWLPLAMLLFAMRGFDLYANWSRAWFIANAVVGVVGVLATLWFWRALWYRPDNAAQTRALEGEWGGRRLLNVQRFLDELAEFQRE